MIRLPLKTNNLAYRRSFGYNPKPVPVLTFGHQTGKVDFAQLAQTLQQQGIFKAHYPARKGEWGFSYPKFPGDRTYESGPNVLRRYHENLPQTVINAQRHAMLDALRQYMPEHIVEQWMHEYFQGDYLRSPEFRTILGRQRIPCPSYEPQRVPESLSFNFNAPERKRRDRNLFTNIELDATQRVYNQHPAIPLAVVAFQTAMATYLKQLSQALAQNHSASKDEKKQGQTAIENLLYAWQEKNFIVHILPAICIAYYKNHSGDLRATPTERDFIEGMNFALESGMFHHHVQPPRQKYFSDPEHPEDPSYDTIVEVEDQNPRRFTCAAAGLITHLSAIPLAGASREKQGLRDTMGVAMAHIYQDLLRRNRPETLAKLVEPLIKD